MYSGFVLTRLARAEMTVTMLSDADAQSITPAARGILQDLDHEVPRCAHQMRPPLT